MSTLTNILQGMVHADVIALPAARDQAEVQPKKAEARPRSFADEQIEMLVRQLFFPGTSKAARHVVVSAVDDGTYIAELCMDVAKALAGQVPGSVCVMEANQGKPELEEVYGDRQKRAGSEGFGFLRSRSQHIGGGLYLAPSPLLYGTTGDGKSPAWLERRLSDFRLEFDYTVLHAPAAGRYGDAATLGRLSDGVVLVLAANATRRVAAQKAKERLQAVNARVLGTVLSERTFPIPPEIYKRL